MDIIVDTRETNHKSNAALIPDLINLGLSVSREQLDVGDYILYDREDEIVIVSRKAGDLFTSIFDGHFQRIESVHDVIKGRFGNQCRRSVLSSRVLVLGRNHPILHCQQTS